MSNEFFRQQDREEQKRKIRDLESNLRESESKRDDYKRARDQWETKYRTKSANYDELLQEVNNLQEILDRIRNRY